MVPWREEHGGGLSLTWWWQNRQWTHLHSKKMLPWTGTKDFKIVPLLKEIVLLLTSVLQTLPVREQLCKEHTRTKLGRGTDGVSMQSRVDLMTILTLITANNTSGLECLEDSPKPYKRKDSQVVHMKPWPRQQSKMPFHMWLRPLGIMTGETLPLMKTESLHKFYHNSSEPTGIKTLQWNNKKCYLVASWRNYPKWMQQKSSAQQHS